MVSILIGGVFSWRQQEDGSYFLIPSAGACLFVWIIRSTNVIIQRCVLMPLTAVSVVVFCSTFADYDTITLFQSPLQCVYPPLKS